MLLDFGTVELDLRTVLYFWTSPKAYKTRIGISNLNCYYVTTIDCAEVIVTIAYFMCISSYATYSLIWKTVVAPLVNPRHQALIYFHFHREWLAENSAISVAYWRFPIHKFAINVNVYCCTIKFQQNTYSTCEGVPRQEISWRRCKTDINLKCWPETSIFICCLWRSFTLNYTGGLVGDVTEPPSGFITLPSYRRIHSFK